ncbi:MAG: class I SAM-dependent methyltransferase, partial [Sphingobacteriales bacterium]
MIVSPITLKPNVKLRYSIPSDTIISLYKDDFGIDVASYFKNLDTVSVFECLDSGLLFYSPRDLGGAESLYDQLKLEMPLRYGQDYYPKWKWEYDVSKRYIGQNDNVYEIGAGNGAFLSSLLKDGVKLASGSELNQKSIESAKEKGVQLELETIEAKASKSVNYYDVVCTFQVLEHVENVHSFLTSALNILKKGGKLIIAVPYNDPF